MKTREQRLEEALNISRDALANLSLKGSALAEQALVAVRRVLEPPLEYEDVKITQYTVMTPNGGCLGTYPTLESAKGVMHDTFTLVPLIGSYRREKKQAVERTVSGEVVWRDREGYTYPIGTEINFDWDEIIGKRGVITFTWLEDSND